MSFETTLVCDGCSTVLDGGRVDAMLEGLAEQGGRAFFQNDGGGAWSEVRPDEPTAVISTRHLCAGCRSATTFFIDGRPVPTPTTETTR